MRTPVGIHYNNCFTFFRKSHGCKKKLTWSGVHQTTLCCGKPCCGKETLLDITLEEDSIDNQKDNDKENHLPVVNPADVDSSGVESGKDGDGARVEISRSKYTVSVSETAQFNDQIPPAQVVSSDQPVMDNDLGAMGPRHAKRQCGTPNKLQYHKLGNPLTLVIQPLLQGLSSALTTSLEEPMSTSDCSSGIMGAFPSVVTIQPHARG